MSKKILFKRYFRLAISTSPLLPSLLTDKFESLSNRDICCFRGESKLNLVWCEPLDDELT